MALTLAEAIARVPLWQGARDLKTAPLGGGITNQNWRVDVENQSYVLRIGGENTELLGIDRRNERAANEAAARIGLAPEVVYFIEPEGYLVTRFIQGRSLPREVIGKTENLRRVADALKRFHGLPAIPGKFSPFRTVAEYADLARRYGVTFPSNFDWLIVRIREIETALEQEPVTPHPCHNDLLNENFLDDGAIRIIDWEYAGMGDVAFDLANFAVHHGLTHEQDRYLLGCYFGQATVLHAARHELMKIASDCREALWAMVQIGISKLDFDFRAYAAKHFDRMTEMIQDPQYAEWLGAF
jgi:thiamine kinase-like enzyme